jgi:hypothetical protein
VRARHERRKTEGMIGKERASESKKEREREREREKFYWKSRNN